MADKISEIKTVLTDLLADEDILAASLALKSGGAISPSSNKFRIKTLSIWQLVANTANEAFLIFDRFAEHRMDKIRLETSDLEIVFFEVNSSALLLCVIPSVANKGLLDVEIANARRRISRLLEGRE